MENKVLAKVDGRVITQSDMELLMSTLGPERAAQFMTPEGSQHLLGELINQELFYFDAQEQGYEQTEEFQNELESAKENLLKQFAIKKILDSVTVSDEDAKAFYEANKEHFNKPATVRASHILVDEEEQAKSICEEIKGGLDFEEAAKKHSKCPSNERGGDLGPFGRGQMVPEFENAAFELEENVVSEPVKTQFGYHIIKVTSKSPEGISTFEEVEAQILQQVAITKQNEAYFGKVEELKKNHAVEIME